MYTSQSQAKKSTEKTAGFDSIDLLLPDINGVLRGKRVSASALEKVLSSGIKLPASLFGTNINGDAINDTGLGLTIGEPDYTCRTITDQVTPVPWQARRAQVLMTMLGPTENEFEVNPRCILGQLHEQMKLLDLTAVIAVELEFYLLAAQSQNSELTPPINPHTGRIDDTTQVYYMDDLDAYSEFTDAVIAACEAQGIPADAAVSEYAPGQFEINLAHTSDLTKACDDAILLKRTIKSIARQHGYVATFMAKPFAEQAGSGMHIHASLYNESGDNVLLDETVMQHAIAGLQQSMADAMLLFAPHANSYRRFQPDMYVPLSPTWGTNNRTVALRIPAEGGKNTRIEHRIAGADANPYLVTAAVVAGILFGISDKLTSTPPSEGDATQQIESPNPAYWHQAIDCFQQSEWLKRYFGEQFQFVFSTVKRSEMSEFETQISETELQWYLQTV